MEVFRLTTSELRLCTLCELKTIYSLTDMMDMLEILDVHEALERDRITKEKQATANANRAK